MTDKNSYTRRAALGLMGAGAAFAVSETSGFTQITADRSANVDVASDKNAYLKIVDKDNQVLDSSTTYESAFPVYVTNQTNGALDITISSSNFDISDGSSSTVSSEGTKVASVQLESGTSTDTTGNISVSATNGLNIDLDRSITLGDPSVNNLNLWFDGAVNVNTSKPRSVNSWDARSESGESNRRLKTTSSSASTYQTKPPKDFVPTVKFDGSNKMELRDGSGNESTTDLTSNGDQQATLFFVFQPESSDNNQTLFRFDNGSEYIRYNSSNSTVTADLGSGSTSIQTSTTSENSPYLLTVRVTQNDSDSSTTDVEARINSNSFDTATGISGSLFSANFVVGGDTNGFFIGRLAEARVYNKSLDSNTTPTLDSVTNDLTTKWL
ncbi:hypothetical protein [Halocalculus aciditolerans]|uniref:Uncharacterized protein n=1 Tax=Halocalculus aciditolerans TaxID=1383812 RepID=A0A830FBI8_9EURY|nr:hypothetical protein [Halocalculus aciditolerans]GGL58588.1 hypothetical protein GCM10009039_16040 [Halocalculus aciditolerans]